MNSSTRNRPSETTDSIIADGNTFRYDLVGESGQRYPEGERCSLKRCALDTISPGASVGRPVVDRDGRVLLNAGVVLTPRYISTLADKGFKHLFVRDVVPPETSGAGVASPSPAHVEAAQAVTHAFTTVHRELGGGEQKPLADHLAWCTAKAAEELIEAGGPIQAVVHATDALLAELEGGGRPQSPIVQHAHEDSIGEHSVRVADHCVALGEACDLSGRGMRQLVAGALLHDIGKAFAVLEPGADAAAVYHTTIGFELLRACESDERVAPYVAYEHHEFQDGTGLPRGLVGSNRIERNRTSPPVPTLVGEIAAIANAYDRLATGVEGDSLPPDWALNVLRGHSGTRYNEELVKLFAREVTPYPLGEDVIVEGGNYEGYTAIVQAINPRHAAKPLVMAYRDASGAACDPIELDLLNDSGLSVRGIPYL